MEENLKISGISQPPLIGSSSNFKLKLRGLNQKKRKLEVSKNTSNLVDIFSRNIESNPAVESESKDSPAKRRKYYRVGGGQGWVTC